MMQTVMPPDCVEFNGEEFGLGMYHLGEDGIRRGGLLTLDPGTLAVKSLFETEFGILDLRPLSEGKWLSACSDGSVKVIGGCLVESSADVSTSSGLTDRVIMSLDGNESSWASISTGGELSWFKLSQEGLKVEKTIQAHSSSFETWAVGVHASRGLTVTGSDDSSMCLWSTSTGEKLHANLREHSMGVTSFHFEGDNELLSGSYDDRIRVWDLRNLARPTKVVKVGGGVWRIRQLKQSKQYLIAACYGGAEVWSPDLGERVCQFDKHDSMVYGIATDQASTIVTCSFYDKMVHRWSNESIKFQ